MCKPVVVITTAWPISLLLAFLSSSSASVAQLPDLKARAAGGDPNAQISLGIAYRDGKGVARDRLVVFHVSDRYGLQEWQAQLGEVQQQFDRAAFPEDWGIEGLAAG